MIELIIKFEDRADGVELSVTVPESDSNANEEKALMSVLEFLKFGLDESRNFEQPEVQNG